MIETRDRYRGALLGLAAGDALGTTLEFRRPGSFAPLTDMAGGGPFDLSPGQWTDDTSMALCLAESLIECRGFDAADQLERYTRWYENGHLSSTGRCFDIGNTTRNALNRFRAARRKGGPLPTACGTTTADAAGNGSIMRLAPVALAFAADPADAIRRAAESSITTHGARESVDACRYLAALIVGALRGEAKDTLLSGRYDPAAGAVAVKAAAGSDPEADTADTAASAPGTWDAAPLAPAIDAVARGSFRRRRPPQIRGTGYVVQSLEAALWAFHATDDFDSGCLAAVNLGDDADTTGAVYGQLAGAFYGAGGIRAAWIERLAMRDRIVAYADALLALRGGSG
jgi:ADP-ribosyl-[dinitrogen reductase] hydrolase